MSQISQLFTFHNGSLINRLETVEISQGITLPIYDQRMMEFDDGVFHPTTHQQACNIKHNTSSQDGSYG